VCKKKHQEYWQPTSGLRHAKNFLSKLSAKSTVEFLKFNRSQARQVTGLLTGHCHLKGHFFKLGIADNNFVRCTIKEREAASHIYMGAGV
jgi:hypothetical protein